MSIEIVRGTNAKPVASAKLVDLLSTETGLDGQMFMGYPIINTPDGVHSIDAILISPSKGVVIVDLVEGTDAGDYETRQDDIANQIEARLKVHRGLLQRRQLRVPIHTLSFAPAGVSNVTAEDEAYPITTSHDQIRRALDRFGWNDPHEEVYKGVLSALENLSSLRKSRTARVTTRPNSRGAKLLKLEKSIATLDHTQNRAVIETVDGVQRIRGLAGSGKTIVLALKAAYLHAQHPDWHIAVTFNTRSLKGQFKRLITDFFVKQTDYEPDWDRLRVVNSWGAPGHPDRDGVYHQFCRLHDIEYHDFRSARAVSPPGREFSHVCELALSQASGSETLYDVILVDEAQDFSADFLRLCHHLLGEPKRLVYAYDELQNLSQETLPSPDAIFGPRFERGPGGYFSAIHSGSASNDIVLGTCYRNSRPVLAAAHALGFGLYRTTGQPGKVGLVQMFDHPHLWEEIGYRVRDGQLQEGKQVTLCRTAESSPNFLEDHSPVDDLVVFKRFEDENAQTDCLLEQIQTNLNNDELRHDDIIVINTNPLTTRKKTGPIRKRLLDTGIQSHLAGVDTDPDVFYAPGRDSLTFTGIHRAKGNEAGMVYIINAQDCHSAAWNLSTIRNRLFTAITRSKAWVRVFGVGDGMDALIQEYKEVNKRDFELTFTYPTEQEREQLRIIHRDMTEAERKKLGTYRTTMQSLVADLDSGKVDPADLDEVTRARLRDLLS